MKEFAGIVTSTFSAYGIIDEEIYFDYKVVKGGNIPGLGSHVTGTEEVSDDVRHALSVMLTESEGLERTDICGPLSRIEHDRGYVDDIPFKLSICDPVPAKGDMLNVDISEFNGLLIGSSVSYARKRRFTAYVLRVTPGDCVLEDLTYFTRDVCTAGYKPQPNDIVCGLAVECVYREFSWRAIEVKPSGSTHHRAPLQLYNLPKFCLSAGYRLCSAGLDSLVMCTPRAIRLGHLNPGDTAHISFTLSNCTDSATIRITGITISDESILRSHDVPLLLTPRQSQALQVSYTNADLGQHQSTITFQLVVNDRKRVQISRRLHVNTITPRTGDCLRAKINHPLSQDCQVIPGVRPERTNPRFYPNHFPCYDVPPDITSDTSDEILSQELNVRNYKYIMHKLLFMEEKFIEEEMQNYSIYQTSLMKRDGYLVLTVPGLVECKLSLLIGDKVLLEKQQCQLQYEGYVHRVNEVTEDIMLKFDEGFQNQYSSEFVDIHFTHNRTSFRRCHLAVDYILKSGKDVIFPKCVIVKPPHFGVSRLNLYNKTLNKEQVSAVKHIIEAKARPLPYLLFGPPGTGKTVTIVEAILQIYHLQSDSRVLVCAPSNSACDLLAQRLLDSDLPLSIVRLNAVSRTTEHLTEGLQRICMSCDEVKEASVKRIIVSTCITAGNLYKLALRTSHFTHVFLDESGQAIESEAMLPIALSTGPGTQAVLAGDPFQLGPVIKNPYCEVLGLQVSLLERLMDLEIYERSPMFPEYNHYDPILLTKLVKNYRANEHLLILPSLIFYENELVPCAPIGLVDRVIGNTQLLVNPTVPIVFHGLRGEEMRENNNPSICNLIEIMEVIRYIKRLTTSVFEPSEIGVITPYRKQAEKTRMMLQSVPGLKNEKIKVASVEDFQGQERPVIIISTVRSNNALPSDKTQLLGFLQNPKRFNVAITRAQAMLVIVGNPDVLKHDECWGALLEFVVEKNCYTGCQFDLN